MPANDLMHRIYGSGYKKIKDSPNASVYAYGTQEKETARIIRYTPFYGVDVLFNDIRLNTAETDVEPEAGLEINYCKYGAFSCTMQTVLTYIYRQEIFQLIPCKTHIKNRHFLSAVIRELPF